MIDCTEWQITGSYNCTSENVIYLATCAKCSIQYIGQVNIHCLQCTKEFEIILTVEEKVYDQVLECFNSRDSVSETPVHVINMNVVDNPEDATIGAFLLCELAQLLTNRFVISL